MRYERKYRIDTLSFPAIEQSVLLHPAGFRKIFPDRHVNNIYFDTLHLQTFHDNVDGIASRKKFRTRWYGAHPFDIKNPVFEIKIKENQVGTKEISPIQAFKLGQLHELTQQVHQRGLIFTKLLPVLQNSYLRSYYGTSDGQYRITIDRSLRYFSYLMSQTFIRYTVEDPGVILEIKYDEHLDEETNRIIPFLPYRQSKSSKYVTGVLLCSPQR